MITLQSDLHFSFLYNDETDHWGEMQDRTVLPEVDKSSPVLSRMLLDPKKQISNIDRKNADVRSLSDDIVVEKVGI